jgi:hypothetical protein
MFLIGISDSIIKPQASRQQHLTCFSSMAGPTFPQQLGGKSRNLEPPLYTQNSIML